MITLGTFRIFSKTREDIRISRCTTSVVGANGKNLQSEKFALFLLDTFVELAYRYIFFFKFILSCQQFDSCYHCLPPMSFTPVAT
jgi:hypothetical protein